MLPVILLSLFLAPANATPAPPAAAPDIDRICAQVTCRPATTVKIRLDGDRVLELAFPRAPFYYNGILNVLPGETLYLEAETVGGQIKSLHAVTSVKNKANTIIVKFEQLHDPKLDRHMLLTVTNPFSKTLRYQAGILRAQQDRPEGTSVCPVGPGQQSFEHWPEPLARVLIRDVGLVEPGSNEAKGCD
jgi:hypothetical protein